MVTLSKLTAICVRRAGIASKATFRPLRIEKCLKVNFCQKLNNYHRFMYEIHIVCRKNQLLIDILGSPNLTVFKKLSPTLCWLDLCHDF